MMTNVFVVIKILLEFNYANRGSNIVLNCKYGQGFSVNRYIFQMY